MKIKEVRKILSEKNGVNRVKITRNGEVHLHVQWGRGDGGGSPWWVYIGNVENIRQELMEQF